MLADAAAPRRAHRASTTSAGAAARCTHDGWKAVTNHVNQLTAAERDAIDGSHDFATDEWALFDTPHRSDRAHDLADERARTAGRRSSTRWFAAAERNEVFPLDDGAVQPHHAHARPVDRVPAAASGCAPATRCTRSPGRTSPAASAWSPTFTDAARADARRGGALRAGRLDLGLGLVPRRGSGHLARDLERSRAPHHRTDRCPARPSSPSTACGARTVAMRPEARVGASAVDGVLPIPFPLVIAPDGAFLTVGYGRPFPVCDDARAARGRAAVVGRRAHRRRGAAPVRPRRRGRPRDAPPVTVGFWRSCCTSACTTTSRTQARSWCTR